MPAMSDNPPNPGYILEDEIKGLAARLFNLENLLSRFRSNRINSHDADGNITVHEVLSSQEGGATAAGGALSPYFVVRDGALFGRVTPHAYLTPDMWEIHRPVVPTLGGVPIDREDDPPEVPLSDGRWMLTLKAGHGVATVVFEAGEKPIPRSEHMTGADWTVLATFKVEEKTRVTELKRHHLSTQHGLRRPPSFSPLLWREENTWRCLMEKGRVWDRTTATAHEAEFSGEVRDGDKLFIIIATGPDGDVGGVEIRKVDAGHQPPDTTIHLPRLDQQDPQSGSYPIEICTFRRTDDAGKDADGNEIFTLWPEIKHTGDIVWQPESFRNHGGGQGKLLRSHEANPRAMLVKTILKGPLNQIQVENHPDEVEIKGNNRSGTLTHIDCGGYSTQLMEWRDGLIVTEGDVSFRAGCDGDSSEAPGPE
jgi:hypothetical protein